VYNIRLVFELKINPYIKHFNLQRPLSSSFFLLLIIGTLDCQSFGAYVYWIGVMYYIYAYVCYLHCFRELFRWWGL